MAEFLRLKKSNCKNCYKCIRHCPIKAIRFSGNQAHIVEKECILCGQCFVVCPQGAKEITDSTDEVKYLIENNDKVIASLAPSIIANYSGIGISGLKKALKSLGFANAEETAVGATLVKNRYDEILENERPNILISSCCHSVNLLIQKHYPFAVNYLADVISPMQAHSIDIKRRHPDAKTVFIGPCVAKKDEADYYKGIVDAVLTFEELTKWLQSKNIILTPEEDNNDESLTRLFPTTGGIIKTMNKKLSDYSYIAVDGIENCIAALKDIENGGLKNCFIEMSACIGSCIGGPVMEKYRSSPIRDYTEITAYAGNKDFIIEKLPLSQMEKELEYIGNKPEMPSDSEITAILRQMGKIKPEHELNCGSCGYNFCREKAIAIFQGKADSSMCLPFLKDKAENFSGNIVKNTPNAIIVLNDELEVQQINKSACKLMNIRSASDVMGELVIRILDPKIFVDVKKNRRGINNQRIYLAEYNKYVEQTVLYDKDYHIFICIMRDITEEESTHQKKEEISRQTIEIADKVVDKQMRIVQEIASLLGETAAETKIALTKLKESISDE